MPEHPSDPPLRHGLLDTLPISWVEAGVASATGVLPVVMVHGLPGSHRDFRWLAPALEPHTRVIRLDMPGFGGSSSIMPRLSPLAEHLLRRLDQLELDRVVLIGHSLGGPQALLASARAPDRVAGLGLLASPGLRPHQGLRATGGNLGWVSRGLRVPLLRHPLMRATQASMQRAGFPRRTPTHEIQRTIDIVARLDFVPVRNSVAALARRPVPTLLAWADDDPLVEPAIAEELAEQVPDGPRLRFASGGHNLQKTCADELGAGLVEWIAGLR